MSRITVIGLDGRPLSAEAESLLRGAALVVGGRRHLAALGLEGERSAVLEGDLSGAAASMERASGPVVVLASGDPGFFGIMRLLGEWFGRASLRVLPAVSSVALAFARAGISWDDAVTVSAHGRDPRRAVNGTKGWVSAGIEGPGLWALPEDGFEHRSGMITKSETRALVLSRLGPGPGDLIWDVGAGSGSVAIECARLGAAAIAIERDPESCARIRHNAHRHNTNVQLIEGKAPEALRDLSEPYAVFVGGSGGAFEESSKLSAVRALRAVVLALATLERVVPAAQMIEDCGLEVETTFLQTSRMKGVGNLHRLAAESAVFVVSGSRT